MSYIYKFTPVESVGEHIENLQRHYGAHNIIYKQGDFDEYGELYFTYIVKQKYADTEEVFASFKDKTVTIHDKRKLTEIHVTNMLQNMNLK